MKTVELYARVRHAVMIEGISERAAAERFGINARDVLDAVRAQDVFGAVVDPPRADGAQKRVRRALEGRATVDGRRDLERGALEPLEQVELVVRWAQHRTPSVD